MGRKEMTEREKFIDKWIAGRKSRTATMADLNADLDKVIQSEIQPLTEIIADIKYDIGCLAETDITTLKFIYTKLHDEIAAIETGQTPH